MTCFFYTYLVIAEGGKTPHTHPAPFTEMVIAGGG